MTCREVIDFLLDYDSGELEAPVRAEFDRHLGICPPCVAYLATYRRSVELGRDAFSASGESALAEVPDELVRAILAARAQR